MNFIFDNAEVLDRVAVVADSGTVMNYLQIRDFALRITEGLAREDLVVVECNNSLDSLAVYLGCMTRGVPVLLVDKELADNKKTELYEYYHVSVVFTDGVANRRSSRGPQMHHDLALLLSTSGSTGSPKLVRLTRSNVQSNARQIAKYLNLSADSRAITTLPQQYSFGLSIINSHLFVGGSIALSNRSITEREFWNFFDSAKPDSLSGVPATLEMLRRMRFERMDLPSLKTMTQAGGRLNAASVKYFGNLGQEKGFDFWVMYGQTEATARMSYLPSSQAIFRSESIGIAIPEGRFEILDPQGVRIDRAGQVGELVYYGPNVMMGYASDVSDLSLGDMQNGRLCTGDLAEFDDEGYYYIRGRMKRFLKIFGNRINLDEVEKDLQGSGMDVYASGRDDQLLIVGTNKFDVDRASSEFCRKFRIHPSAVMVMVLNEIPRNESGKVLYAELLELHESTVTKT